MADARRTRTNALEVAGVTVVMVALVAAGALFVTTDLAATTTATPINAAPEVTLGPASPVVDQDVTWMRFDSTGAALYVVEKQSIVVYDTADLARPPASYRCPFRRVSNGLTFDIDAFRALPRDFVAQVSPRMWSTIERTCTFVAARTGGMAAVAWVAGTALSGAPRYRTSVFDTTTGVLLSEVDGVQPSFSPDGSALSTGGPDGCRLWNPRIGARLATLTDEWGDATFSPDGSLLVGLAGGFELWDAVTLERLMVDDTRSPVAARFSPDGSTFVLTEFNLLSRWDVPTRTEVFQSIRVYDAWDAAFSPDLTLVAAGGALYRAGDLAKVGTIDACLGHALALGFSMVEFSPDGRTLAVAAPAGCLALVTYTRG